MKKIKSILWSLKSGFMQAPILFVFYVLIQILRATLVVYTTVVLGDIISDVQIILDNNGDIEQIWHKLIMFGVLNIIVWLAVNIQWRFNDDFIPLRASVGASKFLINMVKYIPLRKYDDADFCNKYSRFQDGIRSQNNMLKTCIGVGITIYSFVLSCIVLAEIHFSFIIILSVFFVIEMLAVRSHAEIQDNIRKEVTPFRRRADYLQSMFFGICNRDTRIYGLKDHYIEKWADNKRIVTEKDVKGNTKIERINGFLRFIENGLCPLLMIGIAIWFVNEQMLLIGSIYTVWQISRSTLSNSTTATNRILNFMVQCKQADETYAFYKNIKNNLKIKNDLLPLPESGTPSLHIEDMDFSYLPEKKVLHNVNLDVNPGEIIALLGKNGSGKSTLIKLMLGVYSPDKGSVQVFGHNADENEEYIRAHIGTAFQDFCCYPFTLRENVGFGNVSEILDDNKIKSSLSLSQADEILKKAENIDRMLGRTIDNNGIELSGGEWQRVALARAYFGTRDIMIFDEPAAKLDPLAEEKQFANIIKYARENHKTVILVSHRVGFARLADRILFMNDGKITESGSHSDLISLNGEYKQMFDAQREMYAVKEDNV